MIKAIEIRNKFLEFFKTKGHAVINSSSLVPENDPSVLFTTAGMHPLVPYLLGEKHPSGTKLCDFQKCLRTEDIDEVGDNRHCTYFEMLGNWSLGDYFKEESVKWSFEFLTSKEWLNIPSEKLSVTCFEGDNDAPKDEITAKIWEKVGIPKSRIFFLGKEDNWWGPAGTKGPCGSDTEIFYDMGLKEGSELAKIDSTEEFKNKSELEKFKIRCDHGRIVEIWNNVFMEYNKTEEGKFLPLSQKNVDTGMGLE
jgi:alanyl-tRNA synthetase